METARKIDIIKDGAVQRSTVEWRGLKTCQILVPLASTYPKKWRNVETGEQTVRHRVPQQATHESPAVMISITWVTPSTAANAAEAVTSRQRIGITKSRHDPNRNANIASAVGSTIMSICSMFSMVSLIMLVYIAGSPVKVRSSGRAWISERCVRE
jgi:hypothetical protein